MGLKTSNCPAGKGEAGVDRSTGDAGARRNNFHCEQVDGGERHVDHVRAGQVTQSNVVVRGSRQAFPALQVCPVLLVREAHSAPITARVSNGPVDGGVVAQARELVGIGGGSAATLTQRSPANSAAPGVRLLRATPDDSELLRFCGPVTRGATSNGKQ